MSDNIKTLVLRDMPPSERHKKIFEFWEKLLEGETLRIINDHDPKPLYYQFAYEQMGRFDWSYEKKGPDEWIVNIMKIKQGEKK